MSARVRDRTAKHGGDGAAVACTAEQTVLGEGVPGTLVAASSSGSTS